MEQVETLIVGGGIAGLSLAMHLAEAGQSGVLVLDREAQPGFYASGHNAAIARTLTGRPEHTALTVEGVRRLETEGLLAPTGGLLLGAEPGAVNALEQEARAFGLHSERGKGAVLEGLIAAEHLALPGDGVIDTDGLLGRCADRARKAGATLRYGCPVESVAPGKDGFTIATGQGPLSARTLVNAAGAWAGPLGKVAGGLDLNLRPLRRHLVWSAQSWPSDAPWAWWADRPLYLRPESGGLLLCPCDESEVPRPGPGFQPEVDRNVLEALSIALREGAPGLGGLPVVRLWSGLRTFSPDRKFVIGWDPVNPRLFWLAGLGGHGMTSGLAVGAAAATAFLGGPAPRGLEPSRFQPGAGLA
jgi:glycine/D-amino acid oxidase-like deaminating enzyme